MGALNRRHYHGRKYMKEDSKEIKLVKDDQISADQEKETFAKAGKRSAKSVAEAEVKASKKAKKADKESHDEKSAKPVQKTRTKLERRGKNYKKVSELIDSEKYYPLSEAIELTQKTSTTKFNATVELHIKLGVDPRQADQNIRGMVSLPAGTGKEITVAAFVDADAVKAAKDAGASIAGAEELLEQINKGIIAFDTLITTPAMMPKLGKYAKVLGPKGLMPNPKSGTVTKNIASAIKEAKAGKIEYRVDSTGIIHMGVGKVQFTHKQLESNIKAIVGAIRSAKPASIKGNYIQTVFLTTSMGPSIKVSATDLS